MLSSVADHSDEWRVLGRIIKLNMPRRRPGDSVSKHINLLDWRKTLLQLHPFRGQPKLGMTIANRSKDKVRISVRAGTFALCNGGGGSTGQCLAAEALVLVPASYGPTSEK